MDLKQLNVFRCVYEERSFSKAAERLGLSQPTVSGHIKALELSFGVPLLDRLGRKTLPTRAGEFLYRHSRPMLDMRRVVVESMGRFLDRLEGELQIAASTIPGEYILPRFLGEFHQSYPGIRIRLEISDSRAVLREVRAGHVELGVAGARVTDRDLEFQTITSDRLVLAASTSVSWANAAAVSLVDLLKEPLVIREPGSGTRMVMERKLAEIGHRVDEFNVVAELGSTTAIKEAIKAGVGWSIVSALALESEAARGTIAEIPIRELEHLERSFYTVVNTRRSRSPICETFLEMLTAELAAGAPVPSDQK